MKLIKSENGMNTFHFICEGCGAEGELEIPKGSNTFSCPEGCGAVYVQWINSLNDKPVPDLKCVVRPIFDSMEDTEEANNG
ncbi:MAG: hypothetical protein JW908_00690 [Anaerolineales bacterium]|nr:hypothetical protein [Anaerolineales bacterium]